jgi:hypothetical protein
LEALSFRVAGVRATKEWWRYGRSVPGEKNVLRTLRNTWQQHGSRGKRVLDLAFRVSPVSDWLGIGIGARAPYAQPD